MTISRITNSEDSTVAHTDHGRLALLGKRYLLQSGVTIVVRLEGRISVPKIVIPSIGPVAGFEGLDAPHEAHVVRSGGTTDPLLLCIARRGFTQHQNGTVTPEMPVPTLAEAVAELAGGMDSEGELWPVPRLPYVSLDEALALGESLEVV